MKKILLGLILLSCTSAYAEPLQQHGIFNGFSVTGLFAAFSNTLIPEAQAEPVFGHSAYQTGLIYREHRTFRRDHRSRHHNSFYYRHRSDYSDYGTHRPAHGYGHHYSGGHYNSHGYGHGGFFGGLFH